MSAECFCRLCTHPIRPPPFQGPKRRRFCKAGRRTFAGGTAYCATKFAQDGMFGSLQAELEGSNISVCNLYPGLVNTYFNNKQPQGPRPGVLEPKAVAEAIQMAIESPWEHPEIWLKAD
ncbi:MAG: hypothetical protein C0424_08420 [Sphingobacteriaceae bacterium]|nr:hypothetical protein [Sphingobacteriaceae bacterium]